MRHPYIFITEESGSSFDEDISLALLEEKIAGVLIKNFLTPEETKTMLDGLLRLPMEKKVRINEGFASFPMSFAQYTQMRNGGIMTEEDYVNTASDFRQLFPSQFGMDVEHKLIHFFSDFFKGAHVESIYNNRFNKHMIPFTFRELFPGSGELIAHCENLFFDEFPDFFEWLRRFQVEENKFSFFITLQAAEAGGELCCFDIHWDDVKKRVEPTLLQNLDGKSLDLTNESIRRTYIKPEAGDLLLFAGGNVWHRVEKVAGSKSRVTLGGFVAKSVEPGKYYMWS